MNKGIKYEIDLFEKIKENFPELVPLDFSPAGTNSNSPDLVLFVKGDAINIELKMSKKAQFGGSSVSYVDNDYCFIRQYNINEKEIVEKFKEKQEDFNKLLNFHNVNKIPFQTTKKLWIESRDLGLLKPLNFNINATADFIKQRYIEKNINYIQIGGSGLFYFDNIKNLDIPEFNPETYLQFRMIRSGSKLNKFQEKICNVSFRFQAKIKSFNQKKSKYNSWW